MSNTNNNIYPGNNFFAGGQVVPDLLTEQEVIRFLRLDTDGPKHPEMTLQNYRQQGLLRATKVGKRLRYRKTELLKFLEDLQNRTNGDVS